MSYINLRFAYVQQTITLSMRFEHGLTTIQHCLQWYKLVLRTCISTSIVRYLAYVKVFGQYPYIFQ